MMGLTARERDTLDFLRGYLATHGGVGPSMDEIAAALGVQSKANVVRVLNQLEAKMVIRRIPRMARAIEITDGTSSILDHLPADLRRRIEAFCLTSGDSIEGFVIDALTLHLDETEDPEGMEARQ